MTKQQAVELLERIMTDAPISNNTADDISRIIADILQEDE